MLPSYSFYRHKLKKRKETESINSLDDSVLHVDVRTERLVIVHDLPSFDQETVALESNKDDSSLHTLYSGPSMLEPHLADLNIQVLRGLTE